MRYGVLGAGHLGKIHLKCIQEAPELVLSGFYDPDATLAAQVARQFDTTAFDSPEALIASCDIVDIVTPTITHFELARLALQAGRHVFLEKPVTHTVAQAEALIQIKDQLGLQIQVGHVERFNPAFIAMGRQHLQPLFIEGHRLATFNPRGTDVSVVLDLMIHDLDILLTLVPYPIRDIAANGVAVVSDTPDICNARITFDNGCVANLTASRISLKQMRKMRLFQRDAYISIDFLERKSSVLRLYHEAPPKDLPAMELDTPKGNKWISMETPEMTPVNAIRMELESFADAIRSGKPSPVPIEDGMNALKVAYQIIEQVEQNPAYAEN
jgi:predicted dehydrogenase